MQALEAKLSGPPAHHSAILADLAESAQVPRNLHTSTRIRESSDARRLAMEGPDAIGPRNSIFLCIARCLHVGRLLAYGRVSWRVVCQQIARRPAAWAARAFCKIVQFVRRQVPLRFSLTELYSCNKRRVSTTTPSLRNACAQDNLTCVVPLSSWSSYNNALDRPAVWPRGLALASRRVAPCPPTLSVRPR